MGIAQLNARMDAQLKREGDATLARCGVSATEAIRALWGYLARVGELPGFMRERTYATPQAAPESDAGMEGAGMALSLARERGLASSVENMSYDELREFAFDELIAEGACHV